MNIEFGKIIHYDINRGFGFLSQTFNLDSSQVWFHIKDIKYNYPSLAKELDSGSCQDTQLWYEIKEQGTKKSSKSIWLDFHDIPKKKREDLASYIEGLWSTFDCQLPSWLEELTIIVLGEQRKNNLWIHHCKQIQERETLADENLEEKENTARELILTRNSTSSQKNKELKEVYVGLPGHLLGSILWVAQQYRINPLSWEPGGSIVVVERHNEQVLAYDKIKKPSAYIRSFFAGIINYQRSQFDSLSDLEKLEVTKQNIAAMYVSWEPEVGKELTDLEFIKVWNFETSNEMPWEALEKFEASQLKHDFNFEIDETWDDVYADDGWWYNNEEHEWYLGECPECNIPDRD